MHISIRPDLELILFVGSFTKASISSEKNTFELEVGVDYNWNRQIEDEKKAFITIAILIR